MAKDKTQADVELARIRADVERTRIRCRAILWIVALFCLTILAGIVAWAAVRITDKPAWLTLALAGLGLMGGTALLATRLGITLSKWSLSIDIGQGREGRAEKRETSHES